VASGPRAALNADGLPGIGPIRQSSPQQVRQSSLHLDAFTERKQCQLPRCPSSSSTPPNWPRCTIISQWLAGPDHAQLAASFGLFTGTNGDDLTELRTDLVRFTFLPGHDDGEQLFGPGGDANAQPARSVTGPCTVHAFGPSRRGTG
jgi:hypothetical protein